VDPRLHEHDEERALYEAFSEFGSARDIERHAENLRELNPLVDAYFDKVMVMVDDEKVRANRLWLLSKVDDVYKRIGDFSKIVIEEA
jgi:glycyl-tRNA synthetase beta chain